MNHSCFAPFFTHSLRRFRGYDDPRQRRGRVAERRPNTFRSVPGIASGARGPARHEAKLAANGAIVGHTNRTGRSPNDKFIVKDETTAHAVAWGAVNAPFEPERFDALYERVMEHLRGRELYVQDLFCGADPLYRLPVRIVNEYAWHSLFVRQLFLRPTAEELKTHRPEFTVISAPEFKADPRRDGVNSEVFIFLNFTRRTVLIGGTSYAGEMKKSIFSVMNFLLPPRNVFPMHCSANVGRNGPRALR